MSLSQKLNCIWYSQKPFLGFLGKAVSLIYQQVQEIHLDWRNLNKIKLPSLTIPIISIGNLTVGGTGKTPILLSLAQYLEEQGHHCLIITRGYKAKQKQGDLTQAITSAEEGDEAYWLQTQLKQSWVVATPERGHILKQAQSLFPRVTVIILDDAYQAVQLPRDLNIVLIDGQLGVGNGCLLPAGPLREPLKSLNRANFILMTKTATQPVQALIEQTIQHFAEKPLIISCPFQVGQIQSASSGLLLDSRTVETLYLLSGIAHPKSFEILVQDSLNQRIEKHWIFSDHHPYQEKDIIDLKNNLMANPKTALITTGKDWVKLKNFNFPIEQVFILAYSPIINWQKALEEAAESIPKLNVLNYIPTLKERASSSFKTGLAT